MKLLIYDWDFITKHDLYHAMVAQGIECSLFKTSANPRREEQKEQFLENVEKALSEDSYDAVFSINYMPQLAQAAHDKEIPYVCWTYDSPSIGGEGVLLDTSYIFCFDPVEYRKMKETGVPHLYYLPLAADTRRLSRMKPTPMEQMKYYADVSFVGQLYQSNMDQIFPLFDEYGAGYVAALINTQLKAQGRDLIGALVNEPVMRRLCNPEVEAALLANLKERFLPGIEEIKYGTLRAFLQKAVTTKERTVLLSLLAKYCQVKLFTFDRIELPGVQVCGTVDYVREMPLVFQCSKINLNITLRAIQGAIPQRVLDIMGCRALALTNYQEDVLNYFEDGKHLLVYWSVEEAVDKCRYYLKHEKEAEIIRNNAYKIVKDQFTYEHQLSRIWELSGLRSQLSK